jgi:hypothetical protein
MFCTSVIEVWKMKAGRWMKGYEGRKVKEGRKEGRKERKKEGKKEGKREGRWMKGDEAGVREERGRPVVCLFFSLPRDAVISLSLS